VLHVRWHTSDIQTLPNDLLSCSDLVLISLRNDMHNISGLASALLQDLLECSEESIANSQVGTVLSSVM
jgi:hypothetical protein